MSEKIEEKKFQLITWNMPDKKRVNISSEIYDSVDEIINVSKSKKYVIAIGLNPSNKTIFNDDETNLYLRDKIKQKFKETEGYILTNLSCKIESDSKNISTKNIEKGHIENIIKLIDEFKDSSIVVFFGQKGKDFINGKNNEKNALLGLKKKLKEKIDRVYYTKSIAKFIHPGHSGDSYELAELDENTLEMEG